MIDAEPVRVLPLEGVRNFRDLGGYATGDGRRVRWRQLFRSASLGSLTPRVQAVLGELGGRAVLEIGQGQRRDVEALARAAGLRPLGARADLGGIDRALIFSVCFAGPSGGLAPRVAPGGDGLQGAEKTVWRPGGRRLG